MYNLFTITTDVPEVILLKKSTETFKENPCEIPKKKFIFSRVAGSKNEFIHTDFSRFFLKVEVTLFMTFSRSAYLNQNCCYLQIG